jgi:hypothetical protein
MTWSIGGFDQGCVRVEVNECYGLVTSTILPTLKFGLSIEQNTTKKISYVDRPAKADTSGGNEIQPMA